MRALQGSVRALEIFLGQQAPSLRSAVFDDICPALQSPFQPPNLTELDLRLFGDMNPLPISWVPRLCSSCHRLRKTRPTVCCRILQDIPLGQVVSLHSLVELEYNCDTVRRFLPS